MKRLVLALALLVVASAVARAGDGDEPTKVSYRAVVDRIDLEPSSLTGLRLRVYLSALELQGQWLDLTDSKAVNIKLFLGSSEKKVPYSLGMYGATTDDTAIVIMVQGGLDYSDVLPMIADAIDQSLLAQISDHTQVAVMTFGESTGTGKLNAIKTQRGKVLLTGDSSAGDPALLDTLDRALMLLRKAKTKPEGGPLRKMVLVIGDGRDAGGDRDRVTRTGNKAAREGVRIHTMAFSANDVRRPMLALGELSKRSFGTFRWVRKATPESWRAAFEQLRDEINKQYVLTYYVTGEDDVATKKLHIATTGRIEVTSNEMKIGTPMCGTNECTTGYCANETCIQYKGGGGRGVLGWLLLIGGIGLGAVLLLGVIGFFITKKQQQVVQPPMPGQWPGQVPGQMQPPMPAQPKPVKQKKPSKAQAAAAAAAAAQAGLLPNGRPIPALIITSGPRAGERHLLFNGFLIGKQPGCNLIIEDGYTSSQHAQIGMDANGMCKVYDRGSTNGTYVNGARITESALQHGMTLKIGSTEFRFLAE